MRDQATEEARELAAFAIEDAARHAELDGLVRNAVERIIDDLRRSPSRFNIYLVTAINIFYTVIAVVAEESAPDAISMLKNYNAFSALSDDKDGFIYDARIISVDGLSDLRFPPGLYVFTVR